MAYLKRFSLVLGLAAAAAAVSLPVSANPLSADQETAQAEASTPGMQEYAPEADTTPAAAETVEGAEAAEAATAAEAVDAAPVIAEVDLGTDASLLNLPSADGVAGAANDGVFTADDIESVLLAATVEPAPEASDSIDLAQTTRSAYQITPAYLGIGGNIGIGNRGDSALSSFGFNIISKISLGPRFAVRAGATATNDRWGFTIPVTYNFNTIPFAGFRAQPYVGGGVEIPTSGDIGLLVNAGADVPISRDFTLNGVANFRLTSGFALGISLGVGYNFPFIFE